MSFLQLDPPRWQDLLYSRFAAKNVNVQGDLNLLNAPLFQGKLSNLKTKTWDSVFVPNMRYVCGIVYVITFIVCILYSLVWLLQRNVPVSRYPTVSLFTTIEDNGTPLLDIFLKPEEHFKMLKALEQNVLAPVSYTHLTLPTKA